METTAYLKNLRISPKKLRFLLPEVKKLKPVSSLKYLMYTQKKGAEILYKAIESSINNAKNTLKVDPDLLKFKALIIEEGQKLKRYRPGGKGGTKPFRKRFSHIKIVLEAEKPAVKKEVIEKKTSAAKVIGPKKTIKSKKLAVKQKKQ